MLLDDEVFAMEPVVDELAGVRRLALDYFVLMVREHVVDAVLHCLELLQLPAQRVKKPHIDPSIVSYSAIIFEAIASPLSANFRNFANNLRALCKYLIA